MAPARVRALNDRLAHAGPVLYWMDREMRAHDNWALLHAIDLARASDSAVGVVYNLVPNYLGGGAMQWNFKVDALIELEEECRRHGIPFFVLQTTKSSKDVLEFISRVKPGAVVTDMSPLRVNRAWKTYVAKHINVPLIEVDAHSVVPVWVTSEKQEFAARTIRPKIHKNLPEYLTDFPKLPKLHHRWNNYPKTDWSALKKIEDGANVRWVGGENAAAKALQSFIDNRLNGYAEGRNDPNADYLSNLSPYFHYGMLAPQRAAYAVRHAAAPLLDRDAFLEEAVVRRELSDNFCFYNHQYDSFDGFPTWAQETLNAHRKDKRQYIYTKDEFEESRTHDELWNAAQREMVHTGKMHGYMRMYWAKKILEWTQTPEDALAIALALNDRYELDGRDPNGYVGCAWSIGGVHDRPWIERPIFGQIRYMNANGCARKFDVDAYIAKHAQSSLL